MKTYAFGTDGQVLLWCEEKEHSYYVINGDWYFEKFLSSEGEYLIIRHPSGKTVTFKADLLWEGEVPEGREVSQFNHYDGAIMWIQEQIDGK